MNAKKCKMLRRRARVGVPTAQYQRKVYKRIVPTTEWDKLWDEARGMVPQQNKVEDHVTINLDPKCDRGVYQRLKRVLKRGWL
jgi:hypothetical protein